jgi:site-specific recombinase XerD
MFSYLVQAGYLIGNPLALVRRRKRRGRRGDWHGNERHIDQDSWAFALEVLDELPEEIMRDKAEKERLRFLLAALYLLGPRVNELATHTMGSLYQRGGRWWWRVIGKGERESKVPVNKDLVTALKRYRKFLGLTPTPAPNDPMPMILSIKGTSGISANMIYRLVKKFFAHVAVQAKTRKPESVDLFKRVSTHWLRHTSVTHQADAGIALRYINRNARHARLETTGIYMHAEDKKWHKAMDKLHLRSKP